MSYRHWRRWITPDLSRLVEAAYEAASVMDITFDDAMVLLRTAIALLKEVP
jgi:hypothetical protein